jgi:hypothetical protein
MPKQLLVPVRYKRIVNDELVQQPGGMLHDTQYARGATSRAEAADNWADDFMKLGHNCWSVEYVWEHVPNFIASLHLIDYYKHGSSSYLRFIDQDGNRWPMFLGDAVELLTEANMTDGWIEGHEYEVIKRGSAYGIRKVKS